MSDKFFDAMMAATMAADGAGFNPDAEQLAAINSGVTAADVEQIETNKNNILLNEYAVIGKNIFNKNTFIQNAERNKNTGEIISNTGGYGTSAIMPVRSGKKIYFSRNYGTAHAPTYIYSWNKDGDFIERIAGSTTYTVPSNVGYIAICFLNNSYPSYQVEYDKLSAYEAYQYIYSIDLQNEISTFSILASVNMFGSIAGVGDSYTVGQSANSSGTTEIMTEQSYIATMGKRSGVTWHNYAFSGATSKTYITGSSGLPALLAANADDLYIINIGQNDINVGTTVGTIADIKDDYTQNPDTYYGNMGRIITQIQEHAPNAKIILVKSWLNTNRSGTEISYQSLDGAIAEISEHFNIPCIAPFDDVFFNSTNYQNFRVQGHPTTMGYAMIGLAMERLLSKCIVANPSYFQFSTIG